MSRNKLRVRVFRARVRGRDLGPDLFAGVNNRGGLEGLEAPPVECYCLKLHFGKCICTPPRLGEIQKGVDYGS